VTITVRVPASTSNLGAGFDFLGLALDIWLEASLVPGRGRGRGRGGGGPRYAGTLKDFDANSDIVLRLLAERDALEDHRLVVDSQIPIGKGLGSSAAAIVAALVLARLATGDPVDRKAVFRGAAKEEGHPDNAGAAVFGGLVLAADRPTRVDLHPDLAIALAIPARGVSTKSARDLVPGAFPREVAVQQSARSAALVLGLTTGDPELVALGMDDRLAVPHRKRLIEGYDAAEAAGLGAGAFGVTISGAGSAVLALGPPDRVTAIAESMAAALTTEHRPATAATPSVAQSGFVVSADS
jgi:homoserine kinase